MKEASQFFDFVNLREHIRIAKETGAPQFMWTQDPVLQAFRFCNVFREDDCTTRYFKKTVRGPMREDNGILLTTLAWRWFNRIETCSRLTLREWRELDTDNMRAALRDCSPLVTGAYLVKTPNGMSKLEGILWCIEQAKKWWRPFVPWCAFDVSLEAVHQQLMEIPFLGRFMAYEIVTDLRHTYLLEDAHDINSWASAGPGACRGVSRVLYGRPDAVAYGPASGQQTALSVMRELLAASRERWDWPDRPWEMREVEHTLCEYQKYRTAQEGGRLKRRYVPLRLPN